MLIPILGTFTGDPMLDLFAVGLVIIVIILLVLGGISSIIKSVLKKLIFNNKKYK